ncbi:hypothetical protein [Sphingomonas sp.]|uniref:hypothetical protein n=1 Tax=Sphingomonas sp. TaxID=28214 RepID=UPI0025DDA695|nr:hypothetical protein [Sphingomonas sp.]
MMLSLSRALMTLACRCLGKDRHEWAQAMRAEFDAAVEDRRPLTFAIGCLTAALRQMPMREEGRFVLTNYALALAVMVPIAAIEISSAILGLPHLFGEQGALGASMTSGQKLLVDGAFRVAAPSVTLLLLLSGGAQLRLAWLMLERDWGRATSVGAAILAAITTQILFMGSLFLDVGQAVTLGGVLGIELTLIAGLGRWHADLNLPPS